MLIPKASVAICRRSCVDLKTECRLLEESIWRSRLLRKLFEGFRVEVKILSLSSLFYLTPFVFALLWGISWEDGWRKYIGEIHESTSEDWCGEVQRHEQFWYVKVWGYGCTDGIKPRRHSTVGKKRASTTEEDWDKMNRSACGLIRSCLTQDIKY